MKKFYYKINKIKAFTLIEILISMLIISLGFFGIAKTFFVINSNIKYVNNKLFAVNLASKKLSEFENFDSISGNSNSYNSIQSGNAIDNYKNTLYQSNWTVTEDASKKYKNIDITVSWTSKENISNNINMNTIIYASSPDLSGDLHQNTSSPSVQLN